jgi:Ribosomal protein L11, RNA binding domain
MPPASHFLLAATGIADGSARAGPAEAPVGALSLKHIYEIAKARLRFLHDCRHWPGACAMLRAARACLGQPASLHHACLAPMDLVRVLGAGQAAGQC